LKELLRPSLSSKSRWLSWEKQGCETNGGKTTLRVAESGRKAGDEERRGDGEKEGGRDGRREGGREEGREGGREGGREP